MLNRSQAPWMAGLFVAAVAVGALISMATQANATNFSGATGGTGCSNNMADSSAHGFYYFQLTAATTSAVNWARANVVDPTVITTYDDALNSATDVVVYDAYYSGSICGVPWYNPSIAGAVGVAECISLSGSACGRFDVRINLHFMDAAPLADEQALASHEIGHTLGLLHRSSGNTSMVTMYPKPSRYYDSHDTGHLDANYP